MNGVGGVKALKRAGAQAWGTAGRCNAEALPPGGKKFGIVVIELKCHCGQRKL